MKRLIDFWIATTALVLLSPLILFLGILVRHKLGFPILFKQRRPGLKGRPFVMYKFRTLTQETDKTGHLLSDEDRMTDFGRLLRKSSLDELPELFNVLKGEMSLVGPRPLLMEYLTLYSPEQARRHDVLPGITGWAQINGRNSLPWPEKFKLDVWYVDHHNLSLDLKIVLQTLVQVVKPQGISQEGYATAELFMGNVSDEQQV